MPDSVDPRAIVMKEYSTFPKFPAVLESHYHVISGARLKESYLSVKMQSVFSTASANRVFEM